jgi:hypothetical protein
LRKLHETFIALAAQLHQVHEAVKVFNLIIIKKKKHYFLQIGHIRSNQWKLDKFCICIKRVPFEMI